MSPPPLPPAALLFDLDGTLVDTEGLHLESARRVLAAHGREVDGVSFAEFIGWAELPFWEELRRRYRLRARAADLARERSQAYLRILHRTRIELLPGIASLLAELEARGIPSAIASSSPRDQIEGSLRAAGLAGRFAAMVSGHDDVERGKPAPDVYRKAARQLGVPPAACIAVEDSAIGLAAARAAGAYTVGIPNPSHPDPGLVVADRVCTSGEELCRWLFSDPSGKPPRVRRRNDERR